MSKELECRPCVSVTWEWKWFVARHQVVIVIEVAMLSLLVMVEAVEAPEEPRQSHLSH